MNNSFAAAMRPARFFLPLLYAFLLAMQPLGAHAASPDDVLPADVPITLSKQIPNPTIPASGWKRSSFTVAACAVPPKIDGKIDDACWKTATHAAGFYRYAGNSPVTDQTELWFCADKTHLYVAFHCLDGKPGAIKDGEIQENSGGIFQDDFVALDIDSQTSRKGYSTFVVNPRGAQWAQPEGGTAGNLTWAGNWKGAAVRTQDGWSAEMSIPFSLLRYPKNAKSFGILFYRKEAREPSLTAWPYVPPPAWDGTLEGQYLSDFTGIAPPFFAPRPVILPYVLASAGASDSSRQGVDIKYPLTTTLTGVATAFPDFATVEQSVENIRFSYTQKILSDARPFFAEGSGFLPSTDLFYSRNITAVDGGLKIVGKQGDTTLGVFGTTAQGQNGQSDLVFNAQKDFGTVDSIGVNFVGDNQDGFASNRVGRVLGAYQLPTKSPLYLAGFHTQSWAGGLKQDGDDLLYFGNINTNSNTPPFGKLYYVATYADIGPNFISDLGVVGDENLRGGQAKIGQFNQFDKGVLQNYNIAFEANSYEHHTGGFFKKDADFTSNVNINNGLGYEFDYDQSQREQYHDHDTTLGFSWGNKTLYQQGSLYDDLGTVEHQHYNFLNASEGILVSRPFSAQVNFSREQLGQAITTQTILTGTYRLTAFRGIGARLVSQGNATNVFFSISEQPRSGSDYFLLIGDPNSARTRGIVFFKVVHPM